MFAEKIVVRFFEYVRRSFVFSAMVFGGHIFHEIAFCFTLVTLQHREKFLPNRSDILAEGTAEFLSSMEALHPKLIRAVPAYAILFRLGGALRKGSIRHLAWRFLVDPSANGKLHRIADFFFGFWFGDVGWIRDVFVRESLFG